MLIAHAGRPVSNDLIAEAVDGEDLPDRGRRRVQTYVSTLRSIIGDVVVKDGRGWSLRVDRDQIDALRFEDLYESVREPFSPRSVHECGPQWKEVLQRLGAINEREPGITEAAGSRLLGRCQRGQT